jgi:hypothetical protein
MNQPSRDAECKACGAPFIRYNTIQALCRDCSLARQKKLQAKARIGRSLGDLIEMQGKAQEGTPLRTISIRKPIKQQGKEAAKWKTFRDKVAIPYLDNKFGHVCSKEGCTETENLDVDHIKTRGAHPELRYVVTNMRYLCRPHHIEVTGVPRWTPKAAA